jgi:hypothetical protein
MPAARVGLEAPWPSLVALIVTATASVALFFGAPAVFGLIAGFAQ